MSLERLMSLGRVLRRLRGEGVAPPAECTHPAINFIKIVVILRRGRPDAGER
jgi:hypothetical protein